MNKGTILYIGGFELPDKNAAAHRVLGNVKCLRDIGYEVILVGVSKDKDVDKNNFDVQGFKCYNIKYPESKREWLTYLTSIKDYRSIIDIEKPSKIIAYDFPALSLYRLKKLSGIEIYADITEWYEPKGNFIFKIIKGFDVNLRMKHLHKKLNGLIVISDYLENYYSKVGVENIINIPPLVDISEKKWNNEMPSISKEDKTVRFIYSGSPGSGNKDRLDIVVESLKPFYVEKEISIVLDVVGITKEYYVEHFNNNNPLNAEYDFINFHGRVSHLHSIELLKGADFSVFFREDNLTNNAGFPTKFAESISAGTPVITNASSNIKKHFFGNNINNGFIIDDLSPSKISNVFKEIFSLNKETPFTNKEKSLDRKSFDYGLYNSEFLKLLNYNKND
jgi:hypothetical protein